jgi:hypothetical protein
MDPVFPAQVHQYIGSKKLEQKRTPELRLLRIGNQSLRIGSWQPWSCQRYFATIDCPYWSKYRKEKKQTKQGLFRQRAKFFPIASLSYQSILPIS